MNTPTKLLIVIVAMLLLIITLQDPKGVRDAIIGFFKWTGKQLFNLVCVLFYGVYLAVRIAFMVYNYFSRLAYRIRTYEESIRLTKQEEAELNSNVFEQPLGI